MLQPLRDTFNVQDHPNLLVGLTAADDAAVYRIDERRAIVTTADFFPPIVDNPYDFGAIAAANALSDIYAMGGQPLYALNLVAFPSGLDLDFLREILRGGAEKVAEAGAVVAGGHSVTDKEPKYGLAATGVVEVARIRTKGGSRPGDRLLLTKPLGTGVVTTALKHQSAKEIDVSVAVASMKKLNRQAAEAAAAAGVLSMTDVTGFGLLGHAHEMAHLSKVDIKLFSESLPWLPGTRQYGLADMFPGGMSNNRYYFNTWVDFAENVSRLMQDMLWTPETSGGLLASVRPESVSIFQENCPSAVLVGEVLEGDGRIRVE